jgi:hypothetical protein
MTQHGDRNPASVTVPYEDLAEDPALWSGVYGSMTDFIRNEEATEGGVTMYPAKTVEGELVNIVEKLPREQGKAARQVLIAEDGAKYETNPDIAPRIRLVEKAKSSRSRMSDAT